MTIEPWHGKYSVLRDVISAAAKAGFEDHFAGNVTTGRANWFWEIKDAPCIVVHQADPFHDIDDIASQCEAVVRFEVIFVAGTPGADHVGALCDHWSGWLIGKRPFSLVTEHPQWSRRDMPPVVESVGGFRFIDFGHGQPLIASVSTIRTEIHMEK